MRSWLAESEVARASALGACCSDGGSAHADLIAGVIPALGEDRFGATLLGAMGRALPVGSLSVYRTGARPAIFLTASLDARDTTRDCWRAYLSGPIRQDRTLQAPSHAAPSSSVPTLPRLCHITADEVPGEHRARVYEAHGVAERISVVEEESDGALFAVNFYRHGHQHALRDHEIADFSRLGNVVMVLARKHIALAAPVQEAHVGLPAGVHQLNRLRALQPDLTARELEVCARLLKGMSQEGIAADLGIALTTVKTYRNRAFARLGIHFRNELFALASGTSNDAAHWRHRS